MRHFDELRYRIICSLIMLIIVFIGCYYFSNDIYTLISKPILSHVASDTKIIATQVTAPFMVPLQLSLLCTLLICAPFLLYQLWMFIKPGLYKHERKNIVPLLLLSSILFYLGLLFAIFIICPIALKFFTNCAPTGVTIMLDIGSYLDFVVKIAIACGIAFQIPIITNLAIRYGIVTKQQLISKRRHIIVLAFVLGMLLAPPDVISQILLALPIWGLFELGLLFSPTKNPNKVITAN
jgi:Twin arginine targeting (Tat) protein translocase TatC